MGSRWPMILIPDALEIVLQHTRTLSTERVSIADALGRVLAQTVTAPDALPPFPASIKVRHWKPENRRHRAEPAWATPRSSAVRTAQAIRRQAHRSGRQLEAGRAGQCPHPLGLARDLTRCRMATPWLPATA